jgi:hypothetical protein
MGTMADQQCAAKTEHGIRCSNAAIMAGLCRHHELVELSRTPEGRASTDAMKEVMDRRWRRVTIKNILQRPDAAEIVAELTRALKARTYP